MRRRRETQPEAIGRIVKEEHDRSDREAMDRLNLDMKGDPADPFKAAVEKAIPQRVKMGVSPLTGARTQEIVSNKDREPGK